MLVQRISEHAGNQEDKDRRQLEQAAPKRTATCLRQVPGREGALDNELIRTPIPDANGDRGHDDPQPREGGMGQRVPERPGLHHLRLRLDGCFQQGPAACKSSSSGLFSKFAQRKISNRQRTGQNDAGLNQVRIDHG